MSHQITGGMGDKEIVNDSIATQKHISESYNTYANECVNENLRNDFLNILNEEHQIQADLFNVMQSHGWYQVQPAEQNKITMAKQKFMQS